MPCTTLFLPPTHSILQPWRFSCLLDVSTQRACNQKSILPVSPIHQQTHPTSTPPKLVSGLAPPPQCSCYPLHSDSCSPSDHGSLLSLLAAPLLHGFSMQLCANFQSLYLLPPLSWCLFPLNIRYEAKCLGPRGSPQSSHIPCNLRSSYFPDLTLLGLSVPSVFSLASGPWHMPPRSVCSALCSWLAPILP